MRTFLIQVLCFEGCGGPPVPWSGIIQVDGDRGSGEASGPRGTAGLDVLAFHEGGGIFTFRKQERDGEGGVTTYQFRREDNGAVTGSYYGSAAGEARCVLVEVDESFLQPPRLQPNSYDG